MSVLCLCCSVDDRGGEMTGARSTGDDPPQYETLQTIEGNELIQSQQPESSVHSYKISDDHNGAQATEEGDGPEVFSEDHNRAQASEKGDGLEVDGDGPEVDEVFIEESVERAKFERTRKGKQVQVEAESDD
ncbi:hypothetical protein LWI29_001286 [Acer saccharum]|uniref:Uncharacterized protein n=1 Tax=Acer saccharum TaxID=4024 RepID=A0AA39SQP4_ACESA|nr:hypothetical protein LWI29_001286 [Acer saccharum]